MLLNINPITSWRETQPHWTTLGTMSDKQEFTQTENVATTSKKRGCARHCKRFWWIYLIVLIVIIVVAVPLM